MLAATSGSAGSAIVAGNLVNTPVAAFTPTKESSRKRGSDVAASKVGPERGGNHDLDGNHDHNVVMAASPRCCSGGQRHGAGAGGRRAAEGAVPALKTSCRAGGRQRACPRRPQSPACSGTPGEPQGRSGHLPQRAS